MARKQEKKSKSMLFSLSEESAQLLGLRAEELGMNKTAYVEWLIFGDWHNSTPTQALKYMDILERTAIDKHNNIINDLAFKRQKAIERIGVHEDFQKAIKFKKKEAIAIIKRKIGNGDEFSDIQRVATSWAGRLNVDFAELIYLAKSEIHNESAR